MNTTYKPVDREFLEMLAAAKARGITWMRLAEMTKKPVVELEVIPWREPKEWAKACKYAEKLLQHEALSEMLAQLRTQMNDNVNNARSKSQVANSVVRVIQLQHALRTPKKPKKAKVRATPEPTPMPVATSPAVNEPVVTSSTLPVNIPKSASSTPLATVAAIFLLLLGVFAGRAMPLQASETPVAITQDERPEVAVGRSPLVADSATLPVLAGLRTFQSPFLERSWQTRGGCGMGNGSRVALGVGYASSSPADAETVACRRGRFAAVAQWRDRYVVRESG